MKFDTPGRAKLFALGLGPTDVARRLGKDRNGHEVHSSTASRWLAGESRPDDVFQPLMEKLWGIHQSDWLTAEERRDLASRLATSDAPTGTNG
jgi:hypothetical protein